MADRALLAGNPRYPRVQRVNFKSIIKTEWYIITKTSRLMCSITGLWIATKLQGKKNHFTDFQDCLLGVRSDGNDQIVASVYSLTSYIQDCFLPKGSYAYQSSIIISFMKFLCVWINKTSKIDNLRKVYCLKRLWSERNDWIWLHLFITKHVLHDISYVQQADRSLHGVWNSLL